MKVKRMVEELQKFNPDAEVKLHHRNGNNALFILSYVKNESTVVIEDKDDNDLRAELSAHFDHAAEEQMDELDFFIDLLDTGFTLEDIRENLPEQYEYSERFCREHGLI